MPELSGLRRPILHAAVDPHRHPGEASICIALLLLFATAARAQDRADATRPPLKHATAVRVPADSIRLDGVLDDEVWQQVPAITDFVQKEPREGAPPQERTEVRFAYDDRALYVGARMHSRSPIQAPMGRRDSVDSQSEHILVSLDTFLDRRTAYTFGVTASGVRLDRYHPVDDEATFDAGFEPVWKAETRIDEHGWTAELWIPFSQLRFNDRPEQIWGLNMRRFVPTLEEQDYWVPVPRTERAWASRFGELQGIDAVRPARRLELLPFVASSSTMNGHRDLRNPFDDGRNLAGRVGMDLKVGLGPNLTMDATVNPDFGQVEADPAEVNLTAFETRFAEKRPFFTEGAQLLSGVHENQFYSRRIGARATGPASGDYLAYPSTTTILGAAKLTGRLSSGTSIGMLGAVTDKETARTAKLGSPEIGTVRVAPRAMYGLARVQQEFGPSRSTASVMATAVHRALDVGDPLAALLARDALSAGGDAVLRFSGGEYELKASGVATRVSGDRRAIERIQRGSAHYAQRPDRRYAQFDPTRTTLTGFSALVDAARLSGAHWLWRARAKVDSPGFETNDIGNLRSADGIEPLFTLQYRETRPGRVLRASSMGIEYTSEFNWGGDRQRSSVRPFANLTWRNFWSTSLAFTAAQRGVSSTLTRGGPVMATPGGWSADVTLGNTATAQTRWSGSVTIGRDDDGGVTRRANGTLSFRPAPQWSLSITPAYERLVQTQQYVATRDGGGAPTFGQRYVFGRIDRNTASVQTRLNFTWKPDVNLDVYAEPFAASGRFDDYGELLSAGARQRLTYGTSGTTVARLPDGTIAVGDGAAAFAIPNGDFNLRSFRSTIVLRWEWRPGSTVYFVWQQDRLARDPSGSRIGVRDVFRSIAEPGSNSLVVKASFWIAPR